MEGFLLQDSFEVLEPNDDNFSEFGAVITKYNREYDQQKEDYKWWSKLACFECDAVITFNVLEINYRKFELDQLERHIDTKEVIIPLGGNEILVPVAPKGELDESSIRIFKIGKHEGLVLNAGVYHFLPFAVKESANCIIAFKNDTEICDLAFFPLSRRYNILYNRGGHIING